jgi:phenylacetate-CoA ligase
MDEILGARRSRVGGGGVSAVGRAFFSLTQRYRGSRSLEYYREIAGNARLSRDGAHDQQLRLLRDLLSHAEQNVPYYQELFRQHGITSASVRALDDFARIPVLTKSIVREQGDAMLARNFPRETLTRLQSGGSTGVPLVFYHDARYLQMSDAATYRAMAQCGWRPGDMIAFFWGWNDKLNRMPRWEFEARQWLRRSYQFDPFQADDGSMERWLARWRRLQPVVAYGYASTIARFASFIRRRGAAVPPLRGVFTTAEKLYPEQRRIVESVFQCHAFDCYGSSEIRNIANECPVGSMHVNTDFVVLEVDQASADHEGSGPLLLTSLRSYGMPFIRYRNEDHGRLLDGNCTCGSGFPLMDVRVSRITDHFVFPGNRIVHGEYLTHLMYGAAGIESFQFHQTSLDHLVVWIVPARDQADERARVVARILAELNAMAAGQMVVEVREAESIPLSAAGKHRFTRSDVALPA